jgi:hypothetical protein
MNIITKIDDRIEAFLSRHLLDASVETENEPVIDRLTPRVRSLENLVKAHSLTINDCEVEQTRRCL